MQVVVLSIPLVLLVGVGIWVTSTVNAVLGTVVVFAGLVVLAVLGAVVYERLVPPTRRIECGPREIAVYDSEGMLLALGPGVWRPGIYDPRERLPLLPESGARRPWPVVGLTVAPLPEMLLRAETLEADWPESVPEFADPDFLVSDVDWPLLLGALRRF